MNQVPSSLRNPRPMRVRGFTLIELAVVVAVVGLLLATLLPALARSGPNSRIWQCRNNLRQLGAAWRMYADDNRDRVVLSSDDGTGTANPLNRYAWTSTHLDYSPSAANYDPNISLAKGPLWNYSGKNPEIYKCPADESYVVAAGVAKPRVRSMSMNVYLGGLGGSAANLGSGANSVRLFLKTTDLNLPGPAATFVFLDMREDAIGWGNFYTDMAGYPNPLLSTLVDIPNNLHDSGGNFVFGDGHAETHRWQDSRTMPPFTGQPLTILGISVPYDVDVIWLQNRATAPK